MTTITSFQDIPKYTKARWACNVPWYYLELMLQSWAKEMIVDTNPDFQRGHVWKESQQIAYVEYILRGGEYSKDIKWNHRDWMKFRDPDQKEIPIQLVDGKQRLEAARKFLRNELKVFDLYWQQISGHMGADVDFVFQVNNLKTRKEVLEWYLALNAGGVVHTKEEIEKVEKLLVVERLKGDK